MDAKTHLAALFGEVGAMTGAKHVTTDAENRAWSVVYGPQVRVDAALDQETSIVRFAVRLHRPAETEARAVHILLLRYNATVDPGIGLFTALDEDGTPFLYLDRDAQRLTAKHLASILDALADAHEGWAVAIAGTELGKIDVPSVPAGGIRV